MAGKRPFLAGMLLAAGRGERMEPLSSFIPKPALPVLDRPLLASGLNALWAAGCQRVVVNLHRHPEQVAAAVRQANRGRAVLFSLEPELLGPAGGLAAARPLLGEASLLVANGDTWSQLDLQPLLAALGEEDAVLGLLPHPDPKRWSAVQLDDKGRVVGFFRAGEGPAQGAYLFTGFQLIGPRALSFLPAPPAAMEAFWHPLMARGQLKGVVLSGHFQEAGTPKAFHQLVLNALAQGLAEAQGGQGVFIHPQAQVHESAFLQHTAVSAGACVAAGASLQECVLLPGARVEAGAFLARCLVVAATVPPGACAQDRIFAGSQAVPLGPPA
jgi:NDP-sugar pyrophosphorylase family protein